MVTQVEKTSRDKHYELQNAFKNLNESGEYDFDKKLIEARLKIGKQTAQALEKNSDAFMTWWLETKGMRL